MTPLRDYFIAEGLVLDPNSLEYNFSFNQPLAMSADGRTFVGRGNDPDQPGTFGWIVTLPPVIGAAAVAVPEPSGLLLALVALAAGGSGWRRRVYLTPFVARKCL